RRRAALPEHARAVMALAFSRDGSTLASADGDGVRTWDAATGRPRPLPPLDLPGVVCLAFAPDGGSLAVGTKAGSIWLWEPGAGRRLLVARAHPAPVTSLAFPDDGRVLASASWADWRDRVARLWDASTGRPLAAPGPQPTCVQCVAFAP